VTQTIQLARPSGAARNSLKATILAMRSRSFARRLVDGGFTGNLDCAADVNGLDSNKCASTTPRIDRILFAADARTPVDQSIPSKNHWTHGLAVFQPAQRELRVDRGQLGRLRRSWAASCAADEVINRRLAVDSP